MFANRCYLIFTILFGGLWLFPSGQAAGDEATEASLSKSRDMIGDFGSRLMARLQVAIAEGGPVNGISQCKLDAPAIAVDVFGKYQWDIGRTSLKIRNPNNKPDAWEEAVLLEFERRLSEGEDITSLEYHEQVEMDGRKVFRYMRAIPTVDLCLTCHGENIPDEVASALQQNYPQDRARGFKAGDIRGAFSIMQK